MSLKSPGVGEESTLKSTSSGGYATVRDNNTNTNMTQRSALNIINGVISDDGTNGRTRLVIDGGAPAPFVAMAQTYHPNVIQTRALGSNNRMYMTKINVPIRVSSPVEFRSIQARVWTPEAGATAEAAIYSYAAGGFSLTRVAASNGTTSLNVTAGDHVYLNLASPYFTPNDPTKTYWVGIVIHGSTAKLYGGDAYAIDSSFPRAGYGALPVSGFSFYLDSVTGAPPASAGSPFSGLITGDAFHSGLSTELASVLDTAV